MTRSFKRVQENERTHFQGTLDVQSNERINAVTWGVFPSSEIAQPTIVDPVAFRAWRDEAYELWRTSWIELYEENSPARQLLQKMHDTYCLVSVLCTFYKPKHTNFTGESGR